MHIDRASIKASPYLGIFAAVSDNLALVPLSSTPQEAKQFGEVFGAEVLKVTLAGSSLLGVLAQGNKNGFLVSRITEEGELKKLNEAGVKTLPVSLTAPGNLLSFNDSFGVCAESIPEKEVKAMESFLGVKFKQKNIVGTEVTGSNIVISNKGFIVNPEVSDEEFKALESHLQLKGLVTTANYGDPFVANSVVANSSGVLAGELTSGPEMMRIDEALVGEEK
jgi:translation initiation factor 6